MEVTEKLPDMRYIRNVERDRLLELERLGKEQKARVQKDDDEYYSPGLEAKDVIISSFARGSPSGRKKVIAELTELLSEEDKNRIKEKILNISVPNNLERQNLILGHKLYGAVSKVTDVFGKNVEDIVWEEVKKLPKGVMELDDNVFRVYFDDKKGIVEAVEVLKKGVKPPKGDVEKPNSTSDRNLPKIPSSED
jgi:hypothetical protein